MGTRLRRVAVKEVEILRQERKYRGLSWWWFYLE
jgi:hypothetical protein